MDIKGCALFFLLSGCALAVNYTIDDCPMSAPHNSHLKVFRNSCYSFLTTQQKEFRAAERQCESHQGHLVIIRDAETEMFIYNELRHEFRYNGVVWIGLTDQVQEGHFVWVDGSQATYTNWASGQPGRLGALEDCAAMEVSKQGQWGDYPCSGFLFLGQSHVFVCEYPISGSASVTTEATNSLPVPTTAPGTDSPSTLTDATMTTPPPPPTTLPPTTPPPTTVVTNTPTDATTGAPTNAPTNPPTNAPTNARTNPPTNAPTTTAQPTTSTPAPTAAATTTAMPTQPAVAGTTAGGVKACPAFNCSLDCGLDGYKTNDDNCLVCECDV